MIGVVRGVEGDSDERIYASILRENGTWAERYRELAEENLNLREKNAAARDALVAAAAAIRDAIRSVEWTKKP